MLRALLNFFVNMVSSANMCPKSEKEAFEDFKLLAAKEQRSASNLASKLINDYIKKHKK